MKTSTPFRLEKLFPIMILLGGIAVLLVGLFWALMPFLDSPRGLSPTDWTAADRILDWYTFCVINPKNIKPKNDFDADCQWTADEIKIKKYCDIMHQWTKAEIKARGLLVIVTWALFVGVVFWRRGRRKAARSSAIPGQVSQTL